MNDEQSFEDVLDRLSKGDENAATEVFTRYTGRLIGLARSRLNARLRQKEDPEDVVQSVLRSFFTRHADGQFDLEGWDSLWSLLATITLRKCGRRIERFGTAGRDVSREINMTAANESTRGAWEAVAQGPLPEHAAVLNETLDRIMRGLDEQRRQIVVLRLQGFTVPEIGEQVGRSERSVFRTLSDVKGILKDMESATG